MKTKSINQKGKAVKFAFYAFLLLSAGACTIGGVNTSIFTSGSTPLHPCGVAVGSVNMASSRLPDDPVAISTYEGDNNPGFVYVWKSCRSFLSSAPVTSGSMNTLLNTPNPNPDYIITGITDPEGVAFDNQGNLFIASTSPTPTNIYYINMSALASSAQPDPTSHIPTLTVSGLKSIAISATPVVNPTSPGDTYGQPRGLTYNADDGSLYMTMENYNLANGGNRSTILQIPNPAAGNVKIYQVGNGLQNIGTCLGIAYSSANKCFFMTDIEQKLHMLTWPTGTTNTAGVSLQEAIAAIPLPGVYGMDVGVSSDPTSQDSVFFTTTNALTPTGDLSNSNPQCFLNSIAVSNWAKYVNATDTIHPTPLDPPIPYPVSFNGGNLLVAWGVGVFPYKSTDTSTTTPFHAIIVSDAPKSKVVRFFEQ